MSDYSDFFLNGSSATVQLETLEISHPSFSKTYRIVRNAVKGLTATLETGSTVTFDYYPLAIQDGGIRDNLDATLTVNLGDVGQLIPQELDRVASAGTFGTKPVVKYRTYRSDNLSTPMFGPFIFEIVTLNNTSEGSSFTAQAPSLNINKTGEFYLLDRFVMLRGFL